MILPLLSGFGNYFVPLQIGALDMAFPRVNAASFWLLPVGGLTVVAGSFTKGGAAAAGWTNYVPLSLQGGTGEDLWILGLLIVGTSSLLGAINFIVTVLRLRAPGMTLTRMPIFAWATTTTSILIVLAVPSLTAALLMLLANHHHLGTVFFNPAHGGSIANYLNTFWFFGHPEVYMLIMGAWGVVWEIVPVFEPEAAVRVPVRDPGPDAHHGAVVHGVGPPHVHHGPRQRLVLLGDHRADLGPHRGAGPVLAVHAVEGEDQLRAADALRAGLHRDFVIGGIDSGVDGLPAADFSIHDTYFVVSHIHYVLLGGSPVRNLRRAVLLVPQDERPDAQPEARPMAVLAPADLVQRDVLPHALPGPVGHAAPGRDLPPQLRVGADEHDRGTISAYVIALSMLIGLANIIITLRKPRNAPADPWGGNTLEWATSSPPPVHNFDALPEIRSERPVRDLRLAISAAAKSAGPQAAAGPDGAGRAGAGQSPRANRCPARWSAGRSSSTGRPSAAPAAR